MRWVDGVLGFRPPHDTDWLREQEYDLARFASPREMRAWLEACAATGGRCRLVAGFCWRWSKPVGPGVYPNDVTIGDWGAPWIEKTEKDQMPLDNQYYKWATDDSCLAQVGSIYSVQGFEFDRVGVIWGEGLVWRDGAWVAQLDSSKDSAFKKELPNSGEDPVEKLRNIYRVLLTRGMLGAGLYVVDAETRAYVESMLG